MFPASGALWFDQGVITGFRGSLSDFQLLDLGPSGHRRRRAELRRQRSVLPLWTVGRQNRPEAPEFGTSCFAMFT